MAYQLNIFLLSFGIVQGALLGALMIRKRPNHPSHLYFTSFLIVVGFQLIFKVASKAWLWYNVQFLYLCSYSLSLLIGPLLFFYCRSRVSATCFKSWDVLHFAPFALSVATIFLNEFYRYDLAPDFFWALFPWPTWNLVSLIVYGLISYRAIETCGESVHEPGLKHFLVYTISAEVMIVAATSIIIRYDWSSPNLKLIFIVLTLLIYWTSYKLMSDPGLFLYPQSLEVTSLKIIGESRYGRSGLKTDQATKIATQLREVIAREKIFLEQDVTLGDIAKRLGVRKNNLSQVINEHFGMSYSDLSSQWRLEYARELLADPANSQKTITTIAFDSGFNSLSAFSKAFKKAYQITPAKFRETNIREMSA